LIIPAEKIHCPAVAKLHIQEIHTGFLSRIGDQFLLHLYQAMQVSRYGILLVAAGEDDTIAGFVSAALNTRKFYANFCSSRYLVKSIPSLFGSVFSKKDSSDAGSQSGHANVWVKCSETLLYPFRRKGGKYCDAELLSIVVSRKNHGNGTADALITELKHRFSDRGVDRFKVVVGAENKRACRFYERNGGRLVQQVEIHRGEISNLFLFNLLPISAKKQFLSGNIS